MMSRPHGIHGTNFHRPNDANFVRLEGNQSQIAWASLMALRHEPRSCSLAEQAESAGLAARKAIHDGWPDMAAQLAATAARYARRVLAAERGEA